MIDGTLARVFLDMVWLIADNRFFIFFLSGAILTKSKIHQESANNTNPSHAQWTLLTDDPFNRDPMV